MDQDKAAALVVLAVFGLQFAAGNIRAAFFPARAAAACRLASHHAWAGAAWGAAIFPAWLVVTFLCGKFFKDLMWYYLGLTAIGLCVGAAQGCVHLAVKAFKIDPLEHPYKAFNAGLGLEIALAFVPLLNKWVIPCLALSGFSGIVLALFGYPAPEDAPPAPTPL